MAALKTCGSFSSTRAHTICGRSLSSAFFRASSSAGFAASALGEP
jgi:hypothetical protein